MRWARSTNAARRWCRSPAASRCCTRRCREIVEGIIAREQIRLSVHQRAADGEEARPVQAEPVSSPGRCISTATRRCTTSRSASPASTTARCRRSSRAKERGFRVNINCTLFNDCAGRAGRRLLRHREGDGRRRHHRLARLRLRARARPAALPQPRDAPRSCSATSSAAARAARNGRSASRACSSTSWPATRATTARRGAIRRAPSSAGSGPAICWAKATPRPSSELMEETDWDAYGTGNYEKCADCMVHSGYEATAVERYDRTSAQGAAAWRCAACAPTAPMAPDLSLDRQRPAQYVFSQHVAAKAGGNPPKQPAAGTGGGEIAAAGNRAPERLVMSCGDRGQRRSDHAGSHRSRSRRIGICVRGARYRQRPAIARRRVRRGHPAVSRVARPLRPLPAPPPSSCDHARTSAGRRAGEPPPQAEQRRAEQRGDEQLGWVGTAAWPSAYQDILTFTFWPAENGQAIRGRGFDLIAATVARRAERQAAPGRHHRLGHGDARRRLRRQRERRRQMAGRRALKKPCN